MMRPAILLTLFWAAWGQAADAPPTVGYVTSVKGEWKDTSDNILSLAQPLTAGMAIRVSAPAAGDSIVVSYVDGRAETHDPKQDPAWRVRSLNPPVMPGNPIAVVYAKWNETQQPLNGVGDDGAALQPSVVKLLGETGSLDIGPAVANVAPGDYNVQLRPLEGGLVQEVKFHAPSNPAVVKVPGLSPGLHTLLVVSPLGRSVGSVTVLVANEQNYERESASFAEARRLTSQWPPQVGPEVVRKFLSLWLTEVTNAQRL